MKTVQIIKKAALAAAIVAPIAFATAPSAQAAPLGQSFSAAIGVNYPTSDNSRRVLEDYGLHVGLGYALPGGGLTTGSPSVDLDYDYNTGHGNTANVVGGFLSDRYYVTKVATAGTFSPYVGAGIGAAYIDGSGHGVSHNVTNFAGKFLVGAKFNTAFVELSYALNGKDRGYDASTLSLSIGKHF